MKGGVILFRGTGGDARRYLESDRSTADEYYLEAGTALAEFAVLDRDGNVTSGGAFTSEQYADWVDWRNPFTGATRGTPRLASHADEAAPGERARARLGSPRFAEMVINAPKSLSVAAALHDDVSKALDLAEADAVIAIRSWLAQHSVTRVGPRGLQEIVGVDALETVTVVHKTSRAGDPHRHIHFQIGTRVYAEGKWRGLDTAALFKQQGAIRALGTAVIAAHPALTQALAAHGLTLDHVTGEVAELERFNAVLSKRAAQVEHNLAALVSTWEEAHPGEEPGPVVRARMLARAWDHQRPHKRPTAEGLGCEEGWRRELAAAGYRPDPRPRATRIQTSVGVDDLSIEALAARALDRCAAGASTWRVHDIQMHVTHLITEHGVTATRPELRDLIALTTNLAASACLSVLPPAMPHPEQVAHLTTPKLIAAEAHLRALLASRLDPNEVADDTTLATGTAAPIATDRGLDADQARAAAAIASTAPLVIVEGAAGAGKTTMLGAAISAAEAQGRPTRVVTPTKKAAEVAAHELGVPTDSVAALVYANGWRWNRDGLWSRLQVGETDPVTGAIYAGPPADTRLRIGERIVVDEAGMLDQDTATALFTLAAEAGAHIALVGDRAQLPAVGRGGVLDIAAASGAPVHDLTGVHRFTDPDYAALTLDLRAGKHPEQLFDRLQQHGHVRIHASAEAMHAAIADLARVGDAVTVATNEHARKLNATIRQARVARGELAGEPVKTVAGSEGLPIGPGDVVMTRRNENTLGVANRQTWTVQHADDRGLWVTANGAGRRRSRNLPAAYVEKHVHLAYACTAYGVQGATTDVAHTALTGASADGFAAAGLDAAGLYVGLTRGRTANTLHIVARDLTEAQALFVNAMERDRADRGLAHATGTARAAAAGLLPTPAVDHDAEFVAAERDRLAAYIDRAQAETSYWERSLATLDAQRRDHAQTRAPYEQAAAVAREHEAIIHAAVRAEALDQAFATVEAVREAESTMHAASDVARHSGWIKRQAAYRALAEARSNVDTLISEAAARWGSAPVLGSDRIRWAERTTDRATSEHPDVVQAHSETGVAARELARIDASQLRERTALRQSILGRGRRADALRRTSLLQKRIGHVAQVIDTIDTMPSADAATYLRRMTQRPARSGGAVGPAMLEPKRNLAPAPEVLGDKPRTSPTLHL